METKAEIIRLLKSTERPGIEDFIEEMESNGFFTAPCSGGNHLCKEGGLAEHSLNVCDYAVILCDAWKVDIPAESVIIATLLHDYGKTGDYGKKFYTPNMIKDGRPTKANPEQKFKVSDSKPFKRNPDILEKNHAIKSVAMINRWIDLTEDEEFAILHHDGLYEYANKEAMSTPTQLLLIVHYSDLWCSRFVEVGSGSDE